MQDTSIMYNVSCIDALTRGRRRAAAAPLPLLGKSIIARLHPTTLFPLNTYGSVNQSYAMPPRLVRLSSALARPPTSSIRITVSRYSTSTDDAVIKTQQVPAPGSGNIRVLLLNRPHARNALSRALVNDLSKHVNSIAAEGGTGPTRALIIASNADAAFCAGADLKERAKMTKEEYVYMLCCCCTLRLMTRLYHKVKTRANLVLHTEQMNSSPNSVVRSAIWPRCKYPRSPRSPRWRSAAGSSSPCARTCASSARPAPSASPRHVWPSSPGPGARTVSPD